MGTAVTSGLLSSDTVIFQGRGMLNAVQGYGDGTNVATINVYDGLDNTGKLLGRVVVLAGEQVSGGNINTPVRFEVGLFIQITGIGAGGLLHWGGMGG